MSEAVKLASGRTFCDKVGAEYRLIPKEGLRRLAQRYGLGMKKYGEGVWREGLRNHEAIEERKNHIFEHLMEYLTRGNQYDDNLAAIVWGCFFLMEAEKVAAEDQDNAKVLGLTEP